MRPWPGLSARRAGGEALQTVVSAGEVERLEVIQDVRAHVGQVGWARPSEAGQAWRR